MCESVKEITTIEKFPASTLSGQYIELFKGYTID